MSEVEYKGLSLMSSLMSVIRPTKSNVDNFDNNYDFNGKVIAIVHNLIQVCEL